MTYGLGGDEQVLAEFRANLKRGFEASGGLLTVTNKRLIFEAHSINMNTQPAEILLGSIARLEKKSSLLGLINNQVEVFTRSSISYEFVVQRRDEVVDLVEQARSQVGSEDPLRGEKPRDEQRVSSSSIASELGKLNDLYRQGAITEQEFADAKARLLGK